MTTKVLKCNTCFGTYAAVQGDGSLYFHVCPPLRNAAYQPNPEKPNYDPREEVPRPNARDENRIPTGGFTSDGKAVEPTGAIKAPGAGSTVIGSV